MSRYFESPAGIWQAEHYTRADGKSRVRVRLGGVTYYRDPPVREALRDVFLERAAELQREAALLHDGARRMLEEAENALRLVDAAPRGDR